MERCINFQHIQRDSYLKNVFNMKEIELFKRYKIQKESSVVISKYINVTEQNGTLYVRYGINRMALFRTNNILGYIIAPEKPTRHTCPCMTYIVGTRADV